jgi:excinuclease ABC subunit C
MDLKEKVKSLPSIPGVYLMKDSIGSIIYVGKSKNLKSRVGSYFINSSSHSPKTLKLVKNLKDFDYIITDTEFEAFMLECKLIKEIKPLYNRKMKNPLSYPYISINMNKKNPCIEITNEPDKNAGGLYWGPYTSKNTVERGLQGLKEFCKIPCGNSSTKNSACLNYSMGLCIGTCLGGASQIEYFNILENIIKLLNGDDKEILGKMICEMRNFAEKFDFETAAKYRDYICAINYLINKSKAAEFSEDNQNIALIEALDGDTIKFFLIKGTKIVFSEKYVVNHFDLEELKKTLSNNILIYLEDLGNSLTVGRDELDESQIIYSYLENNTNCCKYVTIPQKLISTKANEKINNALDILFE